VQLGAVGVGAAGGGVDGLLAGLGEWVDGLLAGGVEEAVGCGAGTAVLLVDGGAIIGLTLVIFGLLVDCLADATSRPRPLQKATTIIAGISIVGTDKYFNRLLSCDLLLENIFVFNLHV
jgi:hypothetical protein